MLLDNLEYLINFHVHGTPSVETRLNSTSHGFKRVLTPFPAFKVLNSLKTLKDKTLSTENYQSEWGEILFVLATLFFEDHIDLWTSLR